MNNTTNYIGKQRNCKSILLQIVGTYNGMYEKHYSFGKYVYVFNIVSIALHFARSLYSLMIL